MVDHPRLCVVVPCYNEEEMLPEFFETVVPVLEDATRGDWAILCVDDGSRDETFTVITDWHRRDSRISGIRLSRNFGHQAALSAGLAYARGEYIGIMDCDLQDPAEVLAHLYRACLDDELDVCFGIRGRRDAPWFLRAAYSAFLPHHPESRRTRMAARRRRFLCDERALPAGVARASGAIADAARPALVGRIPAGRDRLRPAGSAARIDANTI